MGVSRRAVIGGGVGLAVLGVPRIAAAAVSYFVDSVAGNDGNAGTSTATPFETLPKAVSVMAAGDTLNLKRGSVFRTPLNLTGKAGGTTVQAYGTGTDPMIDLLADALGVATNWTRDGTANRWFRTLPAPSGGWNGFLLVLNGSAGNYIKPDAASVLAPGDWFFQRTTNTLSVYATQNPTSHYTSLQYVPQALGATNDIGLRMAAADDPRGVGVAAGCRVSNLVVRGARRNVQLVADATLTDVTAQFSASTNIVVSYEGTYTLTRVRGLDSGSALTNGEHGILFAGSGSTTVLGTTSDWTTSGGNVWSRSLAGLGSPAGNHLIRDWLDFPSRRYVPPQSSLGAVTGPEDWFVNGTTLSVFATGNPASVYTVLLGGRWELMDALLVDCEFDYAGEDAFQAGGNVHPDSEITVASSIPGPTRISRGFENAVDIKSGSVTFSNAWIWQDTTAPSSRRGPTVTIQGNSRDIAFAGCAVSNLLTTKQTMDVQELRPKIASERTMWYSKNQSSTGVVLSHFNGQPHSFLFDFFYNDAGTAQGLPIVAISGDHDFTHCAFHSSTMSSTVRSMHFRGNSTFAASCSAITCDLSTIITEGGVQYRLATVRWDGVEIYLGPGAIFAFDGLANASAKFNGVWRVRDAWYAYNGTSGTRSFSTFLVPLDDDPPATANLTGLQMLLWARLTGLRGCSLLGKSELVRLDADTAPLQDTFALDWHDLVPNALGLNYWAQRATSTQKLVTQLHAGAQRSYTSAQVLADASTAGNLIADTAGTWGGSGNRVNVNSADSQDAYLEPAVTAISVANGVATVTCPGHGVVKGRKVIVTGVTAPTSGLEGAFFVDSVVDPNTFTYRAVRGTPSGAAALSASARILWGRMKPTAAGFQSAPSYALPAGQKDLQGTTVPATSRCFGPVMQ
ncbi:hypothetical protein [Tenggerimyces flavus]|uniref:Uncharacterized protein n=1 Tax=Tenggerimyces flavus TaxID=1708749 RepID=A0ABV7YHV1_9ACTN|nr:hypothetical protein [Tenggerimyces flavus]MBM7786722.1 hypothetical protein [Tenggerimyces flavus]